MTDHPNDALAAELAALAKAADKTDDDIRYYSGGSTHNADTEKLLRLVRNNLPAILAALNTRPSASAEEEHIKTLESWLNIARYPTTHIADHVRKMMEADFERIIAALRAGDVR